MSSKGFIPVSSLLSTLDGNVLVNKTTKLALEKDLGEAVAIVLGKYGCTLELVTVSARSPALPDHPAFFFQARTR